MSGRDLDPVAMAEEALRKVDGGPMAWAHRLRLRYLRGESLLTIQVQIASEALGEVWDGGKCRRRS